jgi:hypothetical protein
MAKVRKVPDSEDSTLGFPLRITARASRPTKNGHTAPSIRVKCGCCSEAVVINHDLEPTGNPHVDTLEINGVMGNLDQWRQVLLPLLQVKELAT